MGKLTGVLQPSGKVEQNRNGYAFDGRLNESFKALNLLLDKGLSVRRVEKADDGLRVGDFVVSPGSESLLKEVAQATGVDRESAC